jgi:vanillate O-demethylase monooxygenase subunit
VPWLAGAVLDMTHEMTSGGGQAMFLKNFWYVAAESSEVGASPLGRILLNEPIVLYRTEDGAAVAFEDRCCHRRAPLSKGRVEGSTLRCGYHGLLFDMQGVCIEVPGQTRVPRSARLRPYPVCERYRWVWLWMGDPALADPSRIPDMRHNDMPGWAATGGHLTVAADYRYLVDNLLDLSHLAFVHANSIGSSGDTNPTLTWTRGADFVRGVRVATDIPPSPRFRKLGVTCNVDITKNITFSPPATVSIEITQTKAGCRPNDEGSLTFHSMILNCMTPETDRTSHYFWASTREYDIDNAEMTKFVHDHTLHAFHEDQDMIEGQQRIVDFDPAKPTVDILGDAGSIQARAIIERLLADERAAPGSKATGERTIVAAE